ncbi:SIS domain-containing protein [Gracilibacillus phocaeensis]|uniref:SIS domain-containing protein n=1 Tax=Gracilibacillus phocaeensis TaxID=2042304 RepID=UPI00102F6F6D|nr:SIS domain-containing protein [Gracilibacillus phocaeensis]
MITNYYQNIQTQLANVFDKETNTMQQVSEVIADKINKGGVVYLFGCGHSHILTEEVFYRAGGLAPIAPILIEELMLHQGGAASSQKERKNHYVRPFLEEYPITANDVLIVISTSGINPVPVDVALYGKEQGATTVALTSTAYTQSQSSRHEDGWYLKDACDYVINNHVPVGDATLYDSASGVTFAPSSSVIGISILQAILAEVVSLLLETGETPPVFLSGNIAGSDQHNKKLLATYEEKVPLLTKNME